MQPETKAIKIDLQQIIAASDVVGINSEGDALTDESSVASRSFGGLWDDEE